MKISESDLPAISPFLEELAQTFVHLIGLYGGIQLAHEEFVRKSKIRASVDSFYRWHRMCTEKNKLINSQCIGPILEVVITLIKQGDDKEDFQNKLAMALLRSGKPKTP